jgi:putative flippase GtrA
MAQNVLGQNRSIWKYSAVRYTTVHTAIGILNFSIAAGLYGVLGVNHHLASLTGHIVHVGVGFFIDRSISFQSPTTLVRYGMPRYWIIECVSYLSIVVTMYIMIDVWGMNPYFSRGIVAMGIASAISYGLNRVWTFQKAKLSEL